MAEDRVRVTSMLNLRATASTTGTLIASMPVGTTAVVLSGPVSASGYIWYRLQTTWGAGWAVQTYLVEQPASGSPVATSTVGATAAGTATVTRTPTPGATATNPGGVKFLVGDGVRVTSLLNLRASASTTGTLIATMPINTTGVVLAGPVSASGYLWYRLETSYGVGWAVQTYLVEIPPPTVVLPTATSAQPTSTAALPTATTTALAPTESATSAPPTATT
jgi:hypothetical protein